MTAIVKAYLTEGMRKIVNDAMDIRAGAGIMQGPRNLLGRLYKALPVGITVEGANILTRSMIVYGQGAIRCHPFVQREMRAVAEKDLAGFDRAFWGHMGHVVRNLFRAGLLSVTRGWLAGSPVGGPVAAYYRKLAWISASFAIMSDIAMGMLGGTLKFREKIT